MFAVNVNLNLSNKRNPDVTAVIISMTKLVDADWLRGVQLFH
jgi:hypothetical protein